MKVQTAPEKSRSILLSTTHTRDNDLAIAVIILSLAVTLVVLATMFFHPSPPLWPLLLAVSSLVITVTSEYVFGRKWLSSSISIEDAEQLAGLIQKATTMGIVDTLPPVPHPLAAITNGTLQRWCCECNEVLKQHRISVISNIIYSPSAA